MNLKIAQRIFFSYIDKLAIPKNFRQWSPEAQKAYLKAHPEAEKHLMQIAQGKPGVPSMEEYQRRIDKKKKEEAAPTYKKPAPEPKWKSTVPQSPSPSKSLEQRIEDRWKSGDRPEARKLQRQRSNTPNRNEERRYI